MGCSLAYMVADISSSRDDSAWDTVQGTQRHPVTQGTGIGIKSWDSLLG